MTACDGSASVLEPCLGTSLLPWLSRRCSTRYCLPSYRGFIGNMATKRIKRPRDPVALAKLIGDIATGQTEDRVEDGRNPCRYRKLRPTVLAVQATEDGH